MTDQEVITADRAERSAAALDDSAPAPAAAATATIGQAEADTLDIVEEALKDVIDPELGINIVDLGLIYGINVGDDNVALLDMTLTSAACPLQDMIEDQICAALTGGSTPVVRDYRINWVWMPPWGPDKITDDGRDQLRAIGFNI